MTDAASSTLRPSRGWRMFRFVALLLSLPILIPAGFILLIVLHQMIMAYVPRASAEMTIAEVPATVTAVAYHNGGRYLDITVNGQRYLRQLPRPMNIFDLGSTSWFSTCVYRTAQNEVAFNMWRYVEVVTADRFRKDEPYRPGDGVKALDGATYLGVFAEAPHGEIVFQPATPPRPAGPFSERERTAC